MSEGILHWDGLETWYRVVGEAAGGRLPVVICHGGPGATHDYVTRIADLARDGRACVLYDQVGNGRSSRRPNAPADFWTVARFKRELDLLVDHLGWRGGYHVVGQSWGGMLAMEHALEHPDGLRSIVVADSPASMHSWVREAGRLRRDLPEDVQATLTRHEEAHTTDAPAYRAAMQVFYDRHVCRLRPLPDEVARSFAALEADPTVYGTMNGPSEFHVVGTLRGWDISDRLPDIDLPALLVSGAHDEATPRIVAELRDRIPAAEWVLFQASSHMPHVEEPDRFLEVVGRFLARVER